MATRADKLKQLAAALPVANKRVADQQAATQQIQMQSQLGQAPAGASKAAVQAAGGQAAAQQAAADVQRAQASAAQTNQVADMALQQQQQQAQTSLGQQRLSADQNVFNVTSDFAKRKLNAETNNEMTKIAWAVQSVKNEEQFKNMMQTSQQLHERNMKMNNVIYDRILAAIDRENQLVEQGKDQAHRKYLYELKREYEEKARKDAADAANNKAAWQAGGTILGAVAGGVAGSVIPGAGTAAGATIGASVGGAAGSYAAGATS